MVKAKVKVGISDVGDDVRRLQTECYARWAMDLVSWIDHKSLPSSYLFSCHLLDFQPLAVRNFSHGPQRRVSVNHRSVGIC